MTSFWALIFSDRRTNSNDNSVTLFTSKKLAIEYVKPFLTVDELYDLVEEELEVELNGGGHYYTLVAAHLK